MKQKIVYIVTKCGHDTFAGFSSLKKAVEYADVYSYGWWSKKLKQSEEENDSYSPWAIAGEDMGEVTIAKITIE